MIRKSILQFLSLRLFIICIFVLLAAALCEAQLTPSQDAYTNTASPTTNFGTKTVLDVESATQTTYIQFDLSSIPAGYTSANLAKASLKLYVNTVGTAGSFNIDLVTGSWSEKTITADLAPALGTTVASSVAISSSNVHDYIIIDVTSAVGDWLSGTQTNDGFALVGNSPLNASFDSKENTTFSHPAELDIVLTGTGTGTITGVTTAAGSGLTGGGTSGTLNLSLSTACSSMQVLQWSGSAWSCASIGGTGTITGVTAGTDLTGGGTSGNVTLNIDTTKVPQLATANTFSGNQSVTGNFSASGSVNAGSAFNLGGTAFAFGSSVSKNAFLGFAGNSTLTGTTDTAVGYGALASITTGGSNVATGEFALQHTTSGQYNTAGGASALANNTTGNNNTAIGIGAGPDSNSPNLNDSTAIGVQAIVSESNALVLGGTGQYAVNVGIGTPTPAATLDVRGTGNFTNTLNGTVINAATGYDLGAQLFAWGASPNETLYLGFSAGNSPANNFGIVNTAVGWQALFSNTEGNLNTAIGGGALDQNLQGVDNTAVGVGALYYNTTGGSNTAIGYNSGSDPSSPDLVNSTALGALADVTESNALVLGSVKGARSSTVTVSVGIGTTAPQNTLQVIDNGSGGAGISGLSAVVGDSAVFGQNTATSGTGTNGGSFYTSSPQGAGVVGVNLASGGTAAYFQGNVTVTGTLTKGGGSFKIDDPLDPAHKYLSHSFVESPDMMNVYNGNVTTNTRGFAIIVLPAYFEALNRDFRYQLTAIGQFAQVIVAKKIADNQFVIRSNKPSVEVSWQVTGIRHDAYADAHRIPNEEMKPAEEQGHYLHPELFGASQGLTVGYQANSKLTDGSSTQGAAAGKTAIH